MLDPSLIQTRYARSADLNIAYQVFGGGGVRLVFIPGWVSNIENLWTLPEFAGFAAKLAQFAEVILLDRRGTGLSDPVANPPTLEERMDDVRAMLDAAGWARAVRCGAALAEAMGAQGVELRVGVHTGECEVFGDKYSGIAVHLGARIAAAAEPGQILVSSTVRDLVVGSGIEFEDRGPQALKGVPDTWHLYALARRPRPAGPEPVNP